MQMKANLYKRSCTIRKLTLLCRDKGVNINCSGVTRVAASEQYIATIDTSIGRFSSMVCSTPEGAESDLVILVSQWLTLITVRKEGYIKARCHPVLYQYRLEGNYQPCPYCGEQLNPMSATADHVVPLSRGGSNSPDNIVVCCNSCNFEKADTPYEEFIATRKRISAGPGFKSGALSRRQRLQEKIRQLREQGRYRQRDPRCICHDGINGNRLCPCIIAYCTSNDRETVVS